MLTQEQLGSIYILSDSIGDMFNSQVPLSALMTFKTIGQPLALNTFQQLNSVTISGVTTPGCGAFCPARFSVICAFPLVSVLTLVTIFSETVFFDCITEVRSSIIFSTFPSFGLY